MNIRLISGAALFLFCVTTAQAINLDQPEVQSFIDSMVEKHDFDREQLRDELGAAEVKQSILDAIARPAEKTKTWAEYRKHFLTRERIDAGAAFWVENKDTLESISGSTGVPVEILVGIIGVETYYGRITGSFRVLDALATLAFSYPPRAKFFRRELEEYLLLVREEGMQATAALRRRHGAAAVHAIELPGLRSRFHGRRQTRYLGQLDRRRRQYCQLFSRARLAARRGSHGTGVVGRWLARPATGTREHAQSDRNYCIAQPPGCAVRHGPACRQQERVIGVGR
jgi:hypothetical protein